VLACGPVSLALEFSAQAFWLGVVDPSVSGTVVGLEPGTLLWAVSAIVTSLCGVIVYLYKDNRKMQEERTSELKRQLELFQNVALKASGNSDAG